MSGDTVVVSNFPATFLHNTWFCSLLINAGLRHEKKFCFQKEVDLTTVSGIGQTLKRHI
jgi:hypothetical protein